MSLGKANGKLSQTLQEFRNIFEVLSRWGRWYGTKELLAKNGYRSVSGFFGNKEEGLRSKGTISFNYGPLGPWQ